MTPEVLPPGGGIAVLARAKLNLTLAVVGRRTDGFHTLHSVFVPLALEDEVAVDVAADAAEDELVIEGSDELPAGSDNLVLRAVEAARTAVAADGLHGPTPPLTVRLTKRIPVAAGLGGGSSDAAAAILAALRAWNVPLSPWELDEAAASVGSDVPFFLEDGPALVTGRGELVDRLRLLLDAAPAVLLVTPRLPVSTPAVFAAYASGIRPHEAGTAREVSQRLAADWRNGLTGADLLARAADLAAANDLLPAALSVAPGLAQVRDGLGRLIGRPVGLSGSGPTTWVLFASIEEAERAAALVRSAASEGRLHSIAPGEPFVAATAMQA